MISLREYQTDLISRTGKAFQAGYRRVCAVAPCGAGKTVIVGWMAGKTELAGNRTLFLVHRKELIDQSDRCFTDMNIRHGIIAPHAVPDYELPVQIGSVQTVSRRMDKMKNVDFIIIDEAQHSTANTWKKIIDHYPKAMVLGVTATPARLGGDGLGDIYEKLIIGPSVDDLISWGNLAPFRYFAPPSKANMDGVRVKMGDYMQSDLETAVNEADIIGDIITNYKKLADGKQAVCYCVSRKHSDHVANMFNKAGIAATHVDGETDKDLRSTIIKNFRDKKIKVLCNVDLLGEGFDVPGMEAVILARPTQSLTLYIQQAMRAMRPDSDNPDKTAVIIDHVGNCFRHGLPNIEHDWTLDKKPRRSREDGGIKLIMCQECFQVYESFRPACPYCGFAPVTNVNARDDMPDEADGELAEIEAVKIKKEKRMEIGRARSKKDLEKIAIDRGYKLSWVHHMSHVKGIRA